MKKFLIVLSLGLLLFVTYSLPVMLPKSDKDITINYFTKGRYSENSIYLYDDIFMVTSDYDNGQKIADNLVNIVGISASFKGDYDDMQKVIKKCKVAVQQEETVGNVHIIYGI